MLKLMIGCLSFETAAVLLLNIPDRQLGWGRLKRWGLLICALFAVFGSLLYFREEGALRFFSRWSGKTQSPQHASLTVAWEYPDNRQDAGITSFINRGEVCIASTAEAILAIDMKTGAIRWKNIQLPRMIIKPQSENPAFPLIAVRQERRGETVIARIDPDYGETLWQQTLPLAFAEVTFDEQTIAAYAGRAVSALDMTGQLLWTKRFDGAVDISYAQWHSGLLIGQFQEKKQDTVDVTLRYLNRMCGAAFWEQQNGQEFPRYVVEKDAQIFSTPDGGMALMRLPDRTRIWKTINDKNDIVAQDGDLLYGMTAAFDRRTGMRRFSYPDGSAFSGLTKDFVATFQEINPQKKLLIFIDKISGEVKQNIEHRAWYFAKYLTEDERSLYFAMYLKPDGPDATEIRSELTRINKQSFAVESIPAGSNLGVLQFKVFTQEQLVFIPSFQRLGGYALSER
ncbi:hypothetical protein U14_02834 [Candidatus Moduliflexus flocculans]|uniref:Pyrrolo-quinoline quinone repeat domain-containing protein n=1 Tax=Candidatus Moduliflexus flocculans TaxID=1499966 RepID=A0A081BMH3_9BACT|nr:hypothetical protein U14_02834 [Candidatus Moduliflexus flocculans]